MKSIIVLMLFLFISVQAQDSTVKKIGFNPKADPSVELQSAIQKASKEKKNILLDVGGEWCIWCHRLHEFIEADAKMKAFIEKHYVVVKVNYSKDNKNEAFFAKYPKVPGYPHFFVLNAKGELLHSQDTGQLEKEKSYDAKKLMTFFKKWAKKK